MYRVVLTSKYKQSLRKIEKSGRHHISDIEKVVRIIAFGQKLDAKYRDHSLTGDMSEYRECHIKSDLLLIYRIYDSEIILVLANIGSHSDIRLLCGVDAAIGACVGYFTGNAIIGAISGGVFGVINYELISKRVLGLAPRR